MNWKSIMDGATDLIMDTFGVSAIYIPVSGSIVDTHVVVDTDIEIVGEYGRVAENNTVLSCLRDDVGIPSAGDIFKVDGKDYTVDGLPEDEAGDEYLVRVIVR